MKRWPLLFVALILVLFTAACGGPEADQDPTLQMSSSALTSSSISIKSGDMTVLQLGDYDSGTYLRWSPVSPWLYGGKSLSAQYKWAMGNGGTRTRVADPNGYYPGECVSLAKSLANRPVYPTSYWSRGTNVWSAHNIAAGTVIATFRNGYSYDQTGLDHTAIFAGYGSNMIYVFDQNYHLDGLVNYHSISVTSGSGPGNAAAFYIVLSP